MNIFCLIPDGELGGAERVFLAALKGLCNEGHHPTVVLPRRYRNGPLLDRLPERVVVKTVPGVLTIQSPHWWKHLLKVLLSPINFLLLLHYSRLSHAQLVYTNTIQITLGARVARWRHLPHLWHIHEFPEMLSFFGFPKSSYESLRRAMQQSNLVFVCESGRLRWEQALYARFPRVHYIYNPVTESHLSTHSSEGDTVRFGYAGGFTAWKRTKALVRVFGLLHATHPKTTLTLLGATPSDDKTEYAGNGVTVLDRTTEPSKFYDSIDVFVLPSVAESWGLSVTEAIAHGCACICTMNTGLVEVFTDQREVLFVPPADDSKLFDAMRRLLDASLRASMVSNSQRALSEFIDGRLFELDLAKCVMHCS